LPAKLASSDLRKPSISRQERAAIDYRPQEIFNSDVYDNWVNPTVAGKGGEIVASGGPLHGFAASANLVIPANGFVVLARNSSG
jgi:hypothetical protein